MTEQSKEAAQSMDQAMETSTDASTGTRGMSRRQALARLGLGAMAVYTAPTVLHLDQTQANIPSGGCNRFGAPSNPTCG